MPLDAGGALRGLVAAAAAGTRARLESLELLANNIANASTTGFKADREFYTAPTDLIPTEGLVKKTALEIVKGAKTDVEKGRAIYEWIVENTFRDPKTRGCGIGDVNAMLEKRRYLLAQTVPKK